MKSIHELLQFNTPAVSDALDYLGLDGALLGIKPLAPGEKLLGSAFTVKYSCYENKPSHFKSAGDYIDGVPKDSVIVIDNEGRDDCTTWGGILTQVAIKKNINGTVVNGAVRDIDYIRQSGYPVYSKSLYMRSGKNRVHKSDEQCNLLISDVVIKPGDIIFGDAHGVIVIPNDITREILKMVKNIQKTEEKIVQAFNDGMLLKDARKKFHYEKPWVTND